jgi:hypothetical protein
MVATITVYFHPARSAGSMEEAVLLGTMAFCYAVFISVFSMAVSVFCETQLGLIEYVPPKQLILVRGVFSSQTPKSPSSNVSPVMNDC